MRLFTFVNLIFHTNPGVVEDYLTVLINLSRTSVKGCQRVIDAGVERHAGALLGHRSDLIREGMCRLLLVMAGGTSDQISSLLSMTEEMGTVIRIAESETGGSGGWSVHQS